VVVRVRRKEEYRGVATPPDLNIETDVINLGVYEDAFLLEGFVDTSGMESGDVVVLKIYIAVDGQNRRLLDTAVIDSPLENPVVHVFSMILPRDAQPRVTVTQTAGSVKSFPYWFVVQVMETI